VPYSLNNVLICIFIFHSDPLRRRSRCCSSHDRLRPHHHHYQCFRCRCRRHRHRHHIRVFLASVEYVESGLSLLVEHPRRRSELTLYVLPRALETSFNYIRKFHSRRNGRLAKAMPIVATVSFQMSIALWMYIQAVPEWDRLNHLNKNALKAVFGSRH